MTSRERLLAALRREPVDHVPCCASFNPLAEALRAGHTWNFPWPPAATLEDQLTYQVGQLGLDQVVDVGISLCRPASGVESRVWVDGGVLHKAYRTPAGELHASIRYDGKWPHGANIPFYSDFNIGHFVKPWIESEADLACFTEVVRLDDTQAVLDEARARARQAKAIAERFCLATVGHVGMGLTGAQHLFGATPLCLLTVDNPDLVDAYLEHEHRINLRAIEVLGDCGIDVLRRNGFYETGDFYGPAMLDRFVGHRLRREADAARAAGTLSSYTVHTGLSPILDYLASLTTDSLFGIDIAFKGIDLGAVQRAFSGKKSLWIGPSSTYHLWKGPGPTREAVRQVFAMFGKTGLILSPCVSAHSIMPWESTLAMIDEWRKLR
jgi:hypothetical protein